MKKILAIALVLAMLMLGLTACGSKKAAEVKEEAAEAVEEAAEAVEETAEEATEAAEGAVEEVKEEAAEAVEEAAEAVEETAEEATEAAEGAVEETAEEATEAAEGAVEEAAETVEETAEEATEAVEEAAEALDVPKIAGGWAYAGLTMNSADNGIGTIYYAAPYFAVQDQTALVNPATAEAYAQEEVDAIIANAAEDAEGYVAAPEGAVIGISANGTDTIYWYDADNAAAIVAHADPLTLNAENGELTTAEGEVAATAIQ